MAKPSDPTNYTLGRGKVLFKPVGDTAFLDLGNAPALTATLTPEKLTHFSSRGGIKVKDLDIVTQLESTGSVTLDEPKIENLKLFSMAAIISDIVQSSSSEADTNYTAVENAWIDLGFKVLTLFKVLLPGVAVTTTFASDLWVAASHGLVDDDIVEVINTGGALPAGSSADTTYHVVSASAGDFKLSIVPGGTPIVLTDDGTGTHAFHQIAVSGTDYDVDLKVGILFSRSEGIITDADVLLVSFSYAALTEKSIKGGTTTTIKGELFYVADPAVGRIQDLKAASVSITPDGDLPMIGDELTTFNMALEFLEPTPGDGFFEIVDRGVVV